MEFLFVLFFLGFFVFILFMIFSGKGKSLMFGGKIIKTMESVSKGKKRMLISSGVKVHVIEVAPNVRNVGLEITQSSGLSYSMVPVSLPVSEAKILADTIYAALEYRNTET